MWRSLSAVRSQEDNVLIHCRGLTIELLFTMSSYTTLHSSFSKSSFSHGRHHDTDQEWDDARCQADEKHHKDFCLLLHVGCWNIFNLHAVVLVGSRHTSIAILPTSWFESFNGSGDLKESIDNERKTTTVASKKSHPKSQANLKWKNLMNGKRIMWVNSQWACGSTDQMIASPREVDPRDVSQWISWNPLAPLLLLTVKQVYTTLLWTTGRGFCFVTSNFLQDRDVRLGVPSDVTSDHYKWKGHRLSGEVRWGEKSRQRNAKPCGVIYYFGK